MDEWRDGEGLMEGWRGGWKDGGLVWFEWGCYALSASKAIFRVRTYNICITYSVR